MNIAIIVFPGSNRYYDIARCLKFFTKAKIDFVGPQAPSLAPYHLVVIPGGFSYGDEGGCGTIAAKQPIIAALQEAASKNKPILGICNGFQILLESKLLPGKLLPNKEGRFIAKIVELSIENNHSIFSQDYKTKEIIKLPIAHYAGRYCLDGAMLDTQQIVLKYTENINGSSENIAGIMNKAGNILGMMPHPENYYKKEHGGCDGAALFTSLLKNIL